MHTYNTEIPVLLFICGTRDESMQIMDVIKHINPRRIYLALKDKCVFEEKQIETYLRKITENSNWDCKISLINPNINDNTSLEYNAINHFFELEEKGVIVDNNYHTSRNFFLFCSALLDKYQEDERVGHISGWYNEEKDSQSLSSYRFTSVPVTTGGWACWRRVWKEYDVKLKTYPYFDRFDFIDNLPAYKQVKDCWSYLLKSFYHNSKDNPVGWKIQYHYLLMTTNRLSINPTRNLIHTQQSTEQIQEDELKTMIHPPFMICNVEEDIRCQKRQLNPDNEKLDLQDGFTYMKNILSSAENTLRIPKIIHQIYEDSNGVPENLKKISKSWTRLNPEWEYMFWDKDAIYNFLATYDPGFIPFYKSFTYDIQRWDAIRYLILYYLGGLYIDMDYECLQPIGKILINKSCFVGCEPGLHGFLNNVSHIIGNAFMATVPRHRFFELLIKELKQKDKYKNPSKKREVLHTTGPMMLTRVYNRYDQKEEITLIPDEIIAPLNYIDVRQINNSLQKNQEIRKKLDKAFAVHHFNDSWSTKGN